MIVVDSNVLAYLYLPGEYTSVIGHRAGRGHQDKGYLFSNN